MVFLKTKLANNNRLSDFRKSELINYFENQYQENVSFRDTRYGENIAKFESIANDSNLTQEQKKAAIKDFIAQQKSETKQHLETQKSENKSEWQKIHSDKQLK